MCVEIVCVASSLRRFSIENHSRLAASDTAPAAHAHACLLLQHTLQNGDQVATINNNNNILFLCEICSSVKRMRHRQPDPIRYLGHDAKIQRGKYVTQLILTHTHTQRAHSHTYVKQSERVKFCLF